MKSEKGVTLLSLALYILIATIAIGILAMISSNFFFNARKVKSQNEYAEEFNKFNMFFIQDVKNNKTAVVTDTTVTFEDGNIYTYNESNKCILRNETIIAKNVQALKYTAGTYEVNTLIKNLITVNMNIGNNNLFQKEIEYVLKYW